MRRFAVVVALLAVGVAACGSSGGEATASPNPTVTVTQTVTAPPATSTASPTATPTAPTSTNACDALGAQGQQLAFLFVTSPTVGTQVHPGFTVSGCANVFEAAFQWELRDQNGNVLAQDNGTASCGTGCVGTVSFTVNYQISSAQVGTLKVYTSSPKDGSDTDVNMIPLYLQPS